MKIINLEVPSYSDGRLVIMLDNGDSISVTLTPEEKERVTQVGREIFTERQQTIAKEIAEAQPFAMIELKPAVDVSEHSDIPF